MVSEYVCSACGYTFRADQPGEDGCPGCGADTAKLWRVADRSGEQSSRPAHDDRPAAPADTETVAKAPAARKAVAGVPGRRRRQAWRLPPMWWRLRAPAVSSWLNRRTLALAAILALWPWPLDDDRLPVPGPGRSATGTDTAIAAVAGAGGGSGEGTGDSSPDRPGRPRPAASPAVPGAAESAVPAVGLLAGSAPRNQSATGGRVVAEDAAVPRRTDGGNTVAGATDSATGDASSGVAPPPGQPSACLPPETRRLVYLLDASVSMGLPHDLTPELEDRLDAAIDSGDTAALSRYRVLLSKEDLTRLQLAKQALGQAIEVTPDGTAVGLVSFHSCRDIRRFGPVERSAFGALMTGIEGLRWHRGGETALSASLMEAYAMIGEARGRIIVITDGKDTCGPPPCELIADLSSRQPLVRVDLVDVSGRADSACLARATGGTVQIAPLTASTGAFVDAVRDLGRACSPAGG